METYMNMETYNTNDGLIETNNTPPVINLEDNISASIISKINDSSNINTEIKKVKKQEDISYIYDYIARFEIEEVVLSNLQKLQEKELINVPFFQKLRKIFNPQMIKSKLMKGLGIRESYTGFHEFMKGERADLPNVGICKIAKTVGYDVMILPIPENITKLEMDRLNAYRESFLRTIENKISELNIPKTRTRSKEKEKPKEINEDFINNLAKSEKEFLSELKIEKNNNSSIGINDVFDDGFGEIEIENKKLISNRVEEDLNPFDSMETTSFGGLSFDPKDFENDLSSLNNDSFDLDNFNKNFNGSFDIDDSLIKESK